MIIHLRICKGRTHQLKVLESQSGVKMAKMCDVLYGGMCSSSRVCAGICEGLSIVSCNETCRIDIRSIDD